tara:strand:- start:34 stop:222 length:189 start_codon:yes stop_codon:yes gene_type:complete
MYEYISTLMAILFLALRMVSVRAEADFWHHQTQPGSVPDQYRISSSTVDAAVLSLLGRKNKN